MSNKPKIAVLLNTQMKNNCISTEDYIRLNTFADVRFEDTPKLSTELMLKLSSGADALLTGWSTPVITPEVLTSAPSLKMIAHSAGSVKVMLAQVKDVLIQNNVVVTNANTALGIGVAEFTLGMMLTTMKRAWWLCKNTVNGRWMDENERKKVVEPYGAVIGIIGASRVGRHLIKLLKNFDLKEILVYDPYLTLDDANNLGVRKVELEELLKTADVVTLHAPSTEETKHMLGLHEFAMMKENAIFINTARGAIVNEPEMIEELKRGRITVCIDVTDPEPPKPDNSLRSLPNVILTPHIAGAVAQNRLRNGRDVIDDLERYFMKNEKVQYPVNLTHWDRLA
ncbi:MAG: hydroxyacid dehydrogenase [Elusimicrobiota bacterium]